MEFTEIKKLKSNTDFEDSFKSIQKLRIKQYIIEVQVIIMKIGQIDTLEETFYAEFMLEAVWQDKLSKQSYDAKKNFNPLIVISNSSGELIEDIWYVVKPISLNKNLFQIIERRKIIGKFWQKFDFKNFPIDIQTLCIEITTSKLLNQVLLVESKDKLNCIGPDAFMDGQEWELQNFVSAKENVNENEISMEHYSSFTFSINASRIPKYYYYNSFFIIFLITMIGLSRFTVLCDENQKRLIIDTSVTLTLITLKWVLNNNLPKISYLTSIDLYILFSIIFIFSQCIYDSVIGLISTPQCSSPYGFYDLLAFIISASLILVSNLVLFIWTIVISSKGKRIMNDQIVKSHNLNSTRLFSIYNNSLQANEFESFNNSDGNFERDIETDSAYSQTIQL